MSMMDESNYLPTQYVEKIENARVTDYEGDLTYTIHINTAKDICMELETYYQNKVIDLLNELIKANEKLNRINFEKAIAFTLENKQ